MDFTKEVQEILRVLQPVMQKNDVAFIANLLANNKANLALEVLCDQLIDQNIIVSHDMGDRIQQLVVNQNLSPESTWEFLCVFDKMTGEPRRLLLPNCNAELEKALSMIIDEVADRIDTPTLALIREFLEVDEITLCVETLFSCLADDQIALSPDAYKHMVDLAHAWEYSEEQIHQLKCLSAEAQQTSV